MGSGKHASFYGDGACVTRKRRPSAGSSGGEQEGAENGSLWQPRPRRRQDGQGHIDIAGGLSATMHPDRKRTSDEFYYPILPRGCTQQKNLLATPAAAIGGGGKRARFRMPARQLAQSAAGDCTAMLETEEEEGEEEEEEEEERATASGLFNHLQHAEVLPKDVYKTM